MTHCIVSFIWKIHILSPQEIELCQKKNQSLRSEIDLVNYPDLSAQDEKIFQPLESSMIDWAH